MSGAHRFRSYADLDSPIHRLPAAFKLPATLVFVTAVVLVPVRHAAWTAVGLGLLAASVRLARVPFSAFLARLVLAEPFVLGVAILALFQGRGLAVFGALVLKSSVCVGAVQLLAHTTRFPDLLQTLRRARVPPALVLALALLHRYLFVVVEESRRMQRARSARTFGRSHIRKWRALSSVVALSFVRSMARAERIAAAMRARGWS